MLGQWLRHLRESAGMTQKDVARAIKYTRPAVTDAENHGDGSRDLFARAGELLGAGDELGRMYDLIADVTGRGMVVVVRGLPHARVDYLQVLLLPEPPNSDHAELPDSSLR